MGATLNKAKKVATVGAGAVSAAAGVYQVIQQFLPEQKPQKKGYGFFDEKAFQHFRRKAIDLNEATYEDPNTKGTFHDSPVKGKFPDEARQRLDARIIELGLKSPKFQENLYRLFGEMIEEAPPTIKYEEGSGKDKKTREMPHPGWVPLGVWLVIDLADEDEQKYEETLELSRVYQYGPDGGIGKAIDWIEWKRKRSKGWERFKEWYKDKNKGSLAAAKSAIGKAMVATWEATQEFNRETVTPVINAGIIGLIVAILVVLALIIGLGVHFL